MRHWDALSITAFTRELKGFSPGVGSERWSQREGRREKPGLRLEGGARIPEGSGLVYPVGGERKWLFLVAFGPKIPETY